MTALTEYEQQAKDFLKTFNLTVQRVRCADDLPPGWNKPGEKHGFHYVVIVYDKTRCLTFDFWDCTAHRLAEARNNGRKPFHPSEYDILACLSSDMHAPSDLAEYIDEFGEPEGSAMHWMPLAQKTIEFGKRLRAFFTEAEADALGEIQ